jgi:plasmid rolling circle replication initiator protein Rep
MEFKGTKEKWHINRWGNVVSESEEVAYMPSLNTQNTEANVLLISKSPDLLLNAQMQVDAIDLSNLDFYNKYGFNVSELIPKTRKLIKESTEL